MTGRTRAKVARGPRHCGATAAAPVGLPRHRPQPDPRCNVPGSASGELVSAAMLAPVRRIAGRKVTGSGPERPANCPGRPFQINGASYPCSARTMPRR